MKKQTVIYPGTFDPITHGHSDLICRAGKLFDRVIVAVAANVGKQPMFELEQRVEMAKHALQAFDFVTILPMHGLLVEFAHQHEAVAIIRGLRAVSDFEYEFQLAGMNRKLAPEIETLFLTPATKYAYISSSLVREIASLGGDVDEFVDENVANALRKRFSQ